MKVSDEQKSVVKTFQITLLIKQNWADMANDEDEGRAKKIIF